MSPLFFPLELEKLWSTGHPSSHVVVLSISFWAMVQTLIKDSTGLQLSLTLELAVLDIDLHNLPPPMKIIIHHILFAARISIARLWKSSTTPSLTKLCNHINLSCHSERMLTQFNPHPFKQSVELSLWASSKYYK